MIVNILLHDLRHASDKLCIFDRYVHNYIFGENTVLPVIQAFNVNFS